MKAPTTSTNQRILRQEIIGSRRLSNYWWAIVIAIGAGGFLLAGLSSYLKTQLIPFTDTSTLIFVPQGLTMCLYGAAGLLLDLYLWLVILLDVGGGYNEFNQNTGSVKIFRWGFPGKNRQVEFTCSTSDIQGVRVEIKEGLNPKRALYLRIKGKGSIPLSRVGQPMALADLENQGAELARFLGVPLEGI